MLLLRNVPLAICHMERNGNTCQAGRNLHCFRSRAAKGGKIFAPNGSNGHRSLISPRYAIVSRTQEVFTGGVYFPQQAVHIYPAVLVIQVYHWFSATKQ